MNDFIPHCDHGHTAYGAFWQLGEGDGDLISAVGEVAPAFTLSEVAWTGGVLGRYARDADGDGFGFDPEAVIACKPPRSDHVLLSGDCNDGNGEIYPGNADVMDGIDNDCDAAIDESNPP